MRRWDVRWLLVALVGCYSPAAVTGLPCEPDKANCPRGQVCTTYGGGSYCQPPGFDPTIDAAVPDDEGVDAPDAPDAPVGPDMDNDFIGDSVDNCPAKPNTNQANEDGDPYGDVCDKCPPLVDGASFDDPDNDGVSGLCDARPNMPGEVIVLFEGFREGLPGTWLTDGTWTPNISAGNYGMATSTTDGVHATLRYPAPPSAAAVLVSSGFTITAVNGNAQYAGVGPISQHSANTDNAIMCAVAQFPGGVTPRLALINTSTGNAFQFSSYELVPGTGYAASLYGSANQFACLVGASTGAAAQITGTQALTTTQPEVGVRVQGVTARVGWVMVVTTN